MMMKVFSYVFQIFIDFFSFVRLKHKSKNLKEYYFMARALMLSEHMTIFIVKQSFKKQIKKT